MLINNFFYLDQMSDITDDGPRYLLEHLATFSVGSEFGKCLSNIYFLIIFTHNNRICKYKS